MNSVKLLPTQVLILGCGDIGRRLADVLPASRFDITGLRRSPPQNPDQPEHLRYLSCDLSEPLALDSIIADQPGGFDIILITMTPGERGDEGYRQAYVHTCETLIASLKHHNQTPRLILLVSSTSVYGQQDGSWVDESSPTQPETFNGKRLLEAETVIRQSGFNHSIIRFSGIYGPGRTRLIEQVRQGRARLSASYTNRIHADDCAGVLAHLIERALQGVELQTTYIATDNQPTPMAEVVAWLAMQLKVNRAIFAPHDPASPDSGNKRCSNQALLKTGYHFRYPTYQAGYSTLLQL